MVAAGEAGGSLEQVLAKLARMMEKRARLSAKIKAALIYPALMATVSVAVVSFIMIFVIPNIANIFLEMNHTLPRPTIILISISNFFSRNYPFIFAAVLIMSFVTAIYFKTPSGKRLWASYQLKLPLMGNFILKIETVRLADTLAISLNSGINLIDALTISKKVVQNTVIAEQMENVTADISKGQTMAEAIKKTGLFSPIFYHMIATGELSGDLEKQLAHVANKYEYEIDNMSRSITALIEPALMLVMGVVVGFMVLALLLPIFEINQMI